MSVTHFLSYNGKRSPCAENQSVLDALTAHGASLPSSCRNGICQTCMMRAISGRPPVEAQKGLKETLQAQHYFLACICFPQGDMEVALPDAGIARVQATVHSIETLNHEIIGVGLKCAQAFDYRPGQFINLFKAAGLGRSYSLASVPAQEDALKLHIRRMPGGQVSAWAHQHLKPGDVVEISQAAGNCFYVAGQQEQPMVLIGTGSGLAPLYGIARDALAQGHTGPIRLYHGSRHPQDLYLVDELRALAARHDNFSYIPCVSGEVAKEGAYTHGRALDVALGEIKQMKAWRVFLCGNPEMVNAARKKTFLAGVAMKDIYADAFTLAVT